MILVAGATGVLGSEIVRRLINRGEKVRAMVRTTSAPEKVARLEKLGAGIVRGDLKDPASLEQACRGVQSVISTVSMILTAQPGDSFEATDREGNKALVDAAKDAGVEKFVFVSFNTDKSPDAPLTNAKRSVEEHLKASGLDYSILQPSLFLESWFGPMLFADTKAGTAKVYGEGTQKLRYVAVADVAELAVQSLTNPAAKNATIPFGGPEEISQRDAVRIFEAAFDRPFSVIEIPEEALEAQWISAQNPLDRTFSALMLGLARGLDSGIRPPFEQFPMQMTSPQAYVRRIAREAELQDSPPASSERRLDDAGQTHMTT